jgi:hypothetical protein
MAHAAFCEVTAGGCGAADGARAVVVCAIGQPVTVVIDAVSTLTFGRIERTAANEAEALVGARGSGSGIAGTSVGDEVAAAILQTHAVCADGARAGAAAVRAPIGSTVVFDRGPTVVDDHGPAKPIVVTGMVGLFAASVAFAGEEQ